MSQTKQVFDFEAALQALREGQDCKAPECLDTVLHKSHAASAMGVWAVRTSAGVA